MQPGDSPRILVIQVKRIGDLVLSAPLVASLKAQVPGAHITVLAIVHPGTKEEAKYWTAKARAQTIGHLKREHRATVVISRGNDPFEIAHIDRIKSHAETGIDYDGLLPLPELVGELKSASEVLWEIEDEIRLKEVKGELDDALIQLARSVYVTNDKRADVKRQINLFTQSDLVEEKSYGDC